MVCDSPADNDVARPEIERGGREGVCKCSLNGQVSARPGGSGPAERQVLICQTRIKSRIRVRVLDRAPCVNRPRLKAQVRSPEIGGIDDQRSGEGQSVCATPSEQIAGWI